jgi:glycosyltransferase involved in cell wall biosynthesis
MSDPLVSVVVPVYEQPELLRRVLKSIAMQDFSDYEVIVSDDSRGDEVEAVVRQEAHAFPQLLYVRNQPAKGSPQNWNHGMDQAKGRYLKIMHHDDWFAEPFALRFMVEALQADEGRLVFGGIKGRYEAEQRNYTNLPSKQQLEQMQKDPLQLLRGNLIGPPSTIMFKRQEARFDPNLKWLVDIEFYLQLLLQGHRLHLVNQVLFENVQTAASVTKSVEHDKHLNVFEYMYVAAKHGSNRSLGWKIRYFAFVKKLVKGFGKVSYAELWSAYSNPTSYKTRVGL